MHPAVATVLDLPDGLKSAQRPGSPACLVTSVRACFIASCSQYSGGSERSVGSVVPKQWVGSYLNSGHSVENAGKQTSPAAVSGLWEGLGAALPVREETWTM